MALDICTNLIPVFLGRILQNHGMIPVVRKRPKGRTAVYLVQPFEKIKNDLKNQDHRMFCP
jgi:hypothetical protein